MGLKLMGEPAPAQRDIRALLEQGCELEGHLSFTGVVRLNGRLTGDVESSDVLIVGATAEVQGDVNIGEIVISGRIQGNIAAKTRVEVLATGVVVGSITSPVLITHEGARIMGEIQVCGTSLPQPS